MDKKQQLNLQRVNCCNMNAGNRYRLIKAKRVQLEAKNELKKSDEKEGKRSEPKLEQSIQTS